MAQGFLGNVRDIAGDDLRPELGFADLDHKVDDVDAGQGVVFDQLAANDDGVLKVVAGPRHKGHDQVFAERQLAVGDRHAFDQHVAFFKLIAGVNDDLVVNGGAFVRTCKTLRLVGDAAALVFDGYGLGAGLNDL